MYEKILIPLDGSELAEVVLPYAGDLAERLDAGLILLRVCEQPRSTQVCRAYLEDVARRIKTQSLGEEPPAEKLPRRKEIKIQTEVAINHPADGILHSAEKNQVAMILMATHGYSGIRRWVIGSVADKVLRKSAVPVWLVRAGITIDQEAWAKQRKIIVPLDGSKAAETVLPHVKRLARQRDDEEMNVILTRVIEPLFITSDYPEAGMALSWQQHVKLMRDFDRREARRYLARIAKRLRGNGLKVRSVVLNGKPAEKLIEFSRRHAPCLMVLAAYGLSGLGGWELGHVADKVLHRSDNPVFLIRPLR